MVDAYIIYDRFFLEIKNTSEKQTAKSAGQLKHKYSVNNLHNN